MSSAVYWIKYLSAFIISQKLLLNLFSDLSELPVKERQPTPLASYVETWHRDLGVALKMQEGFLPSGSEVGKELPLQANTLLQVSTVRVIYLFMESILEARRLLWLPCPGTKSSHMQMSLLRPLITYERASSLFFIVRWFFQIWF